MYIYTIHTREVETWNIKLCTCIFIQFTVGKCHLTSGFFFSGGGGGGPPPLVGIFVTKPGAPRFGPPRRDFWLPPGEIFGTNRGVPGGPRRKFSRPKNRFSKIEKSTKNGQKSLKNRFFAQISPTNANNRVKTATMNQNDSKNERKKISKPGGPPGETCSKPGAPLATFAPRRDFWPNRAPPTPRDPKKPSYVFTFFSGYIKMGINSTTLHFLFTSTTIRKLVDSRHEWNRW